MKPLSPANRILEALPPLHDYQNVSVKLAFHFATKTDHVETRLHGICSPTGTGKSYVGLTLLAQLNLATPDSCYLITPKIEIIIGMLEKIGENVEGITLSNIESYMQKYKIYTPVRFKNRLLAGLIDSESIRTVIIDEAHHDEADGYEIIRACLPDTVRYIGLSATFYRGNPKETAKFRTRWGKIDYSITEVDAYERGFLSLPDCHTWPVVDDDLVEIGSNGEFVISRVTAETKDKLEYVFNECIKVGIFVDGLPTRPTVFGIHSSEIIPYFKHAASASGLVVSFITEATSISERQRLFRECLALKTTLVHINTISEGVDLGNDVAKLRVYIDLASCNSPLLFMQRFGRIRRPLLPSETQPPLYICCNRNLERHGYLLDGLLPASVVREAQSSFPRPSERSKTRVFGIETLGKLKPTNVRLVSGLTVQTFAISCMDGSKKREYLVLLHPCRANPVWFSKVVERDKDGNLLYSMSKWVIADEIPKELKGFKSNPPSTLTEGQQRFWNSKAEKVGLDVSQPIDGKKFQLMPALLNVGAILE